MRLKKDGGLREKRVFTLPPPKYAHSRNSRLFTHTCAQFTHQCVYILLSITIPFIPDCYLLCPTLSISSPKPPCYHTPEPLSRGLGINAIASVIAIGVHSVLPDELPVRIAGVSQVVTVFFVSRSSAAHFPDGGNVIGWKGICKGGGEGEEGAEEGVAEGLLGVCGGWGEGREEGGR